VSAGNANEQRFLLPLVDQLLAHGIHPDSVWADRGYWGRAIIDGLQERGIEPRISRRRDPHEPIADGVATRVVVRGKRRTIRPHDPLGRHRWPIERTNAWIKTWRRIEIRRDVKADNYLSMLLLVLSVILARNF